jgi:glycosyltransferase involved in cell wall biosynthesis
MLPRVLTALPVFNEEAHVCRVLDEVRRYSQDIIVVDDGSSDRTPELLSRRMDVRTLTHEVNQGYGAALRTAFLYALENDYDVLVTIDCDGQHEPRLIPEMAAAVFPTEGEPYDLISGSRYKQVFAGDSVAPEERRRINMEITDWLNRRFHFGLTDAFCGFKAYRVPALAQLQITDLGYAMPLQLWVQAARHQWRITEFPVPLVYLDETRSFGGALDQAQQRLLHYYDVLHREVAAMQFPCDVGDVPVAAAP